MEKNQLIQILDNNVKEIESIKMPYFLGKYDYSKANELLQKTRMLSKKYFSLQFYYAETIGIRFEPISISKFTTADDYKRSWDTAIIELLSIAKAMRDDASLTSLAPPPTKIIEDTSKIIQLSERLKKAEDKNIELEKEFSDALVRKDTEYIKLDLRFTKFKKLVLFSLLLIILSITLWSFNSILKWNWLSIHPKKIALYISFQLLIIFSLLRIVTANKAIKIIDILIALGIGILSFI
jgi:hypothetical protein